MNKYLKIIVLLFALSVNLYASKLITLEQYIKDYPDFDNKLAATEAEKDYKAKNYKLIEVNETVEITSKLGHTYKGKYYGKNAGGNPKIGRYSIQWFDIPDDKKYLFSKAYLERKHKLCVQEYITKKKREYLGKRTYDISQYRKKLLSSNNNILTSEGNIIYNIKIREKNEWEVTFSSDGKDYTFPYNKLPAKESEKFKSGVDVTTLSGQTYKNIKMISKNPVQICFYDENGYKKKEEFKNLSDSTKAYFEYSPEEAKQYIQNLEKEKKQKELAKAKKDFCEKYEMPFYGNITQVVKNGEALVLLKFPLDEIKQYDMDKGLIEVLKVFPQYKSELLRKYKECEIIAKKRGRKIRMASVVDSNGKLIRGEREEWWQPSSAHWKLKVYNAFYKKMWQKYEKFFKHPIGSDLYIYVVGLPENFVDGTHWHGKLYEIGIIRYRSTRGGIRTVRRFTTSYDKAVEYHKKNNNL
ncbi:MAG: hypothetical protein PHX78_12255 [bacterium]|nr:hypothetical protein [bacterium]